MGYDSRSRSEFREQPRAQPQVRFRLQVEHHHRGVAEVRLEEIPENERDPIGDALAPRERDRFR